MSLISFGLAVGLQPLALMSIPVATGARSFRARNSVVMGQEYLLLCRE